MVHVSKITIGIDLEVVNFPISHNPTAIAKYTVTAFKKGESLLTT